MELSIVGAQLQRQLSHRMVMRTCVISCLLLTVMCLSPGHAFADRFFNLPSGWGQQADPKVEAERRRITDALNQRAQAEQAARGEREATRRHIEAVLASAGPEAYRKYSDGTVAYLGLLLYRHEGFIVTNGPAYTYLEKLAVVDGGYKVQDATDAGCRISPLREGTYGDVDSDIFVSGLKGYSGRKYHDVLMLRYAGSLKYRTVSGSSRVIPKFEFGERASKEEYTDYFFKGKLAYAKTPGLDEDSPPAGNVKGNSMGTGFFITDDGYFVTCEHVVRSGASVRIKAPGGPLDARVIKRDRTNDLALLRVQGKFEGLPVAAEPGVKLGEGVFTIGFPNPEVQGVAPKLTRGEISSLAGMHDNPRYFQISVPVQPGNSGGALLDERGNVVGVVTSRLDDIVVLAESGALPQNVNYAVKSEVVRRFLSGLPELAGKLKSPSTEKNRDTACAAAERAVVLVVTD